MSDELRLRIEALEAERLRPVPPRPNWRIGREALKELVNDVVPATRFNGSDGCS